MLMKQEKMEEAKKLAKELLDKNPNDVVSKFKISALYQSAGLHKTAIKLCKFVLLSSEVAPDSIGVFIILNQYLLDRKTSSPVQE